MAFTRHQHLTRPSLSSSSSSSSSSLSSSSLSSRSSSRPSSSSRALPAAGKRRQARSRASSVRAIAQRSGGHGSSGGSGVAGFVAGAFAAAAVGLCTGSALPAFAVDNVKVGTCLLKSCTVSLAKCIADVPCLENLACLQSCNGRPDEGDCQVRCGDLYEDKAVDRFNTCAVSDQQCVPSRADDGSYPLPDDSALVPSFDPSVFNGRWFIVAGLNPTFDTFDCQEHFFKGTPATSEAPGKLYGKLNWRIPKPDGTFISRDTVQEFVQDPAKPAILSNHDNDFLHYEDDWYILGYTPNKYVFVYYRGNNDAWKGYGGAVVYSPERTVPPEELENIRADARKVNLDFDEQFIITNNSCEPPKKAEPLQRRLSGELSREAEMLERALDAEFKVLEQNVVGEERLLERTLLTEEKAIEATIERDTVKIVDELRAMELAYQKMGLGGLLRSVFSLK